MECAPHSGLGKASFVISTASVVAIFGSLVVATTIKASNPGMIEPGSGGSALLGVVLILAMTGLFTALGLGVSGLFQQHRARLFPVLGILVSLSAMSGLAVMITVGLLAD